MAEKFRGEIVGIGYDGEGISRLYGKVAFLPFTLKGEVVEYEKVQEKSSFIRGIVTKVLTKSDKRTSPPCPYFGKCGGCTLQHTDYENEVEIKKELLASQLKKIGYLGRIDAVASPKCYAYRNKITLFVDENGLSLKERGSDNLVPIKKCMIAMERINDAIEKINNFILLQNLQNDILKVVIRQEGEQLLLNFIVKPNANINYQGLYLLIGSCGIKERKDTVCRHVLGLEFLSTNEMGLDCQFDVASFHQVNDSLTDVLYCGIIDKIVGERVINCYSGAGVLSGVIAKSGKEVLAVELGQSEHMDAEKLKKANNLSNLTNFCGDCAKILPEICGERDTIIVDPPRGGMSERVCQTLNQSGCQRIIYVSCNAATLVRDIAKLDNYSISSATMYDMFPRTGEYETLCTLEQK